MKNTWIAGLDIGGTKIAASIADAHGPLARITQPTAKSGAERAPAEQCIAMLKQACDSANIPFEQVDRVGVSACGPFIKRDGLLAMAAPNICGGIAGAAELPNNWTSVPLEQVLRERFAHVAIDNDCVAALAAERAFGNVHGEPDCAYVTWSTGIGFGLCVDGRLLRGKNGNAGHAGHMLLSEDQAARCGCGNAGDTEGLIGGQNLEARIGRTPADIFTAARAGEPDALAVALDSAKWFGRALYNLTAILDTRVFVVGGSIWQHHGDWLQPKVLHEVTSRLPALTAGVSIVAPALGSYVADIGALYQAMPEDWHAEWRERRPWGKFDAN